MEKKISYLNRDFDDYKKALLEYSRKYYPDLTDNFSEASIDSWMIDLNANIADNLSYHIDRIFQETNIDSAQSKKSVMDIARTNGVKIPGPKGAMTELKFSCYLPVSDGKSAGSLSNVDMRYAPVIRRGTMVNSSDQVFEVMEDVDFSSQFNSYGISDRTVAPVRDSNGNILRYRLTKLTVAIAGKPNVYTKSISSSDIKPFMNIEIPGDSVMNIESIIMKEGSNFLAEPTNEEFYTNEETPKNIPGLTRFFEVESLSQQTRWGACDYEGKTVKKEYSYETENGNVPVCVVSKGEWKPVRHKFITEHTETGGIKITFGSGMEKNNDGIELSGASDFAKYQITKMLRNDSLGLLPRQDSVIYVKYREGGGMSSNVPKGAINNIVFLDCIIGAGKNIDPNVARMVKSTISVENTIPSISGKDSPSVGEMKNMVKYARAAQERCVTIKDYKSRIMTMPPEFGSPFRIGVLEENNKIMIYLLGIDYNGKLSPEIPDAVIRNISEYLTNYRMINDFIEIKSGRVINVGFKITVHTDKNMNPSVINTNIANAVKEYMDVSKREMGENIYMGDMLKEISKLDGVVNIIGIEAYNKIGGDYSPNQISQPLKDTPIEDGVYEIDLQESENILYSDGDSMIEVKKPSLEGDIKVIAKPI